MAGTSYTWLKNSIIHLYLGVPQAAEQVMIYKLNFKKNHMPMNNFCDARPVPIGKVCYISPDKHFLA